MMIMKDEEREHVDGAFQDNHRQFMEKIRNQIKTYNLKYKRGSAAIVWEAEVHIKLKKRAELGKL